MKVYCMLCCRGKGDYHRLGHGSADHVRRPRKVHALQGYKIISIATGNKQTTHICIGIISSIVLMYVMSCRLPPLRGVQRRWGGVHVG